MFEKFTEKAIKVIMLAQEEAHRLGHNFVGTEQLLVGLIVEGTGVAARVLRRHGLTVSMAQIEVERLIHRGSGKISVEIPFTQNAKYLLEHSLREAKTLNHQYVGTEHLLLGILAIKNATGHIILSRLGIKSDSVRTLTLQILAKPKETSRSTQGSSAGAGSQEPKFFSRFTNQAINVVMLAQDEARRLGHNFVGTEQVLVGLIEGTGIASQVLQTVGINLKIAQLEVEKITGRGSEFVAKEIPFTPRAKLLLEQSLKESQALEHSYIGTEHLLLGLLSLNEGVACTILSTFNIDRHKARVLTMERIRTLDSGSVVLGTNGTPAPPILRGSRSRQQAKAGGPLKVFLAHAKEDKKLVFKLHTQLKAHGHQPWIDKLDLIPGQNWRSHIPKVIKASDIFLACFSRNSVSKSGFVQKEFRLALDHLAQQPPDAIYLIPVRLDDCEIPDLRQSDYGVNVRDIHWVDYWQEDGFKSLLRALEFYQKLKK